MSGNGVKRGHMHTLAQTLNVIPEGGKELEEPSGKACEEKAILEETLPKRRPRVLRTGQTLPARRAEAPAWLQASCPPEGGQGTSGHPGCGQPLGCISGTVAPGGSARRAGRPQGGTPLCGESQHSRGSPGRGDSVSQSLSFSFPGQRKAKAGSTNTR